MASFKRGTRLSLLCAAPAGLARAQDRPSDLRDHEHDGHDGERDAADGEQPDGAEPQRCVAAGSQRLLQLALAVCADDRQPDRKRRVAAAEQNVRPRGDFEQLRGEAAHSERPAVAPSAVRHHASHVRSAAIDVRRA